MTSLTRKCGDCSACCTAIGVDELNKGEFERCDHQKKLGTRCCKIYDDRPQGCRTFACEWLRGLGSNQDQPDRLGVMFCYQESEAFEHGAVLAYELRLGAAKVPRARYYMEQMALHRPEIPIFVVRQVSDGTEHETVHMTDEHMAQMQRFIDANS